MQGLNEKIIHFFLNQNFVVVSTIDKDGSLHSSCKGIVKIDPQGKVYLLDLYRGRTYENLKENPQISITVVDEHKFKGYCLNGLAKIVKRGRLSSQIISAWEDRITSRVTQRVIRNIRGEKGGVGHPESYLPKPEYLIMMEVGKIVDLSPR